ncbi:MAG: hypothetical protein IJ415_01640, partial [Clostridia bacterium]|nr:hypothetical protein [Clostridia bacterium]
LAGDKYYMLGSFEKNQSLQCLYSKTNTDWERLMSDYPDLEEFLWNSFNEFKTVEKRKEMTLIQRKLDEENKELEFLTDVEKLYERISELKTRKKKYEAQIAEIKDLIETVPFD